MVAVDSAPRLAQYIDEQNITLSKLSQIFEDNISAKVTSNTLSNMPKYTGQQNIVLVKNLMNLVNYHQFIANICMCYKNMFTGYTSLFA